MERLLKSRYRIGENLGESPFSFTYKGYLVGTEVPVVVKIYKRAALNSPLINKLRPKVTKMISLDHPNIARVIDGDYGWQGFYFVREFVEGESLENLLLREIPEKNAAVEIIKQVLSSLAKAHENDLIHGSISPRNIFVCQEKDVRVTDFILEPAVRINPSLLAQSTAFDPAYMSPEQIKGEEVTCASDVYSTGVVFYQLLTGRLPFAHKGRLDLAFNHLAGEVIPPSHLDRQIPDYIDDLVMKMLEKEPMQRISSAKDALASLENKRLVFRLPSQDYLDIIYDDSEPIIYEESFRTKAKQKKKKQKGKRKVKRATLLILFVLIAIASGLWYAFVSNLISGRD